MPVTGDVQREMLKEFKTTKCLSIFWLILDSSGNFIRTDKFIGYVTIKEEKYKWRVFDTDPFWSGNGWWDEWMFGWKHIKFSEDETN